MWIRVLALIVTLCVLPAAMAAAQSPAAGAAAATREVLVRFRDPDRPAAHARVAGSVRGSIVKSNRVLGYHKIVVPADLTVTEAVARLRGNREVMWAEPNGVWTAAACTSCPQDPYLLPLPDSLATGQNQWGTFLAGIPWLWRQGGGGSSSVIVAILDTGIDDFASPHPDLAANVHATGHDFVDDDANPTDAGAANLYGHGTHVAGIVAAAANTSGIAGVAYASKVMVVRVLDCNAGAGCPGTFDDIADGIQFAADNGARVINLSIQGTVPSATVRTAIQYAIGKGSIVIAASGNQGASSVSYPARYEEVIAVGASDHEDHVASFSNYGDELDVVAPGVRMWSTVPGATAYEAYSGTSQATPFVSGIAAIVVARQPGIEQEEMEKYLRARALPLGGADAARDGYGRVAFPRLEDWSDSPPPYSAARHGNFMWEWLGWDASAEPSISDAFDTDFRPNIGASHHTDGFDDGVFPLSFPRLPFLPPHLAGGASVDFGLSVSRYDGPRYGPALSQQLHLDSWFDWDSDGVFETGTAAERAVADHAENPGTWGGNARLVNRPITPVDEHILGNPLRVRTRLSYGASPGNPDSAAKHGEVEDVEMVNFVEDFDITLRVHSPGVYPVMDTWDVAPDPSPPCTHRGLYHMAVSTHPATGGGSPCNGFIERINVMGTPTMNWKEYTKATLTFWYCHQAFNCSPAGDFCRVRIDTSGVKHNLGPIPAGSGTMTIDLTPYIGSEAVIVEFVEETDWNGRVAIDDIVITAYDPQPPVTVANLAVSRTAGTKELNLTWTAPRENDSMPSPPAQGLSNLYDLRYSSTPIVSESDWEAAQRFEPRDVVGAAPLVPGEPLAAQAFSLRVPSAFETYHVALRAGDEVVSRSAISNSPGSAPAATIAIDVLSLADTTGAPGDTVALRFRMTNNGNATDSYGITATDTRAWELLDVPAARVIAPGASSEFALSVVIPPAASAGERDSVDLVVRSLADGITQDVDQGELEVSGATAVAGSEPPKPAGLFGVGPLPFRDALAFGVRLPSAGAASMRIHDLSGRLVRDLGEPTLAAGEHRFAWDGRDQAGRDAAPGFYFLRVRTPGVTQTSRVLRVH